MSLRTQWEPQVDAVQRLGPLLGAARIVGEGTFPLAIGLVMTTVIGLPYGALAGKVRC